MKRFTLIFTIIIAIATKSCVIVNDTPGPSGRPGYAFYGIDYDYKAPVSYWDNNPSMPESPYFGDYYQTNGGIYDFEYFVNRYDYWFGTYEIVIRYGGPGRPYGQPGLDGGDSYLMLICNADGPYEYRKAESKVEMQNLVSNADGSYEYTIETADATLKVKMQKTSTKLREAHEPKVTF